MRILVLSIGLLSSISASASLGSMKCVIEAQNKAFKTVDSIEFTVVPRGVAQSFEITETGEIREDDSDLEDRRSAGSRKFVSLTIEGSRLRIHSGMSGGISSTASTHNVYAEATVTDYVNKFEVSCKPE